MPLDEPFCEQSPPQTLMPLLTTPEKKLLSDTLFPLFQNTHNEPRPSFNPKAKKRKRCVGAKRSGRDAKRGRRDFLGCVMSPRRKGSPAGCERSAGPGHSRPHWPANPAQPIAHCALFGDLSRLYFAFSETRNCGGTPGRQGQEQCDGTIM